VEIITKTNRNHAANIGWKVVKASKNPAMNYVMMMMMILVVKNHVIRRNKKQTENHLASLGGLS